MTLLEEVSELLESDHALSAHCFCTWTESLLHTFDQVERSCFRPELVYTREELREREQMNGFEGLVLYLEGNAVAVLLIYADALPGMIFLDTLAVTIPGRGIGSRILQVLIDTLRSRGYRGLSLETEWVNERGQNLVAFYQKFGFTINGFAQSNDSIQLRCLTSP